jgi:hypothetical protein
VNPRCIQALNSARAAAGGQPMTPAGIKAIDDRMSATMRRLARTDPNWQALTPDQRLLAAAQTSAADIAAEAARKVQNAQTQALKTAETEVRLQAQQQRMGWGRTKTLVDDMDQADKAVGAIRSEYTGRLMDTLEAADSGQGAGMGRRVLMTLFDAQNPLMTRDMAIEIFAQGKGGTGNTLASKGAQAWLKTIETMRQRFNGAGGDVRQLDYGYLPQPHDQGRMLQAGRDQWAQQTLPLLDRSRYLLDDGSRMSDAQVLDVLRAAHETITLDGMNKTTPGQFQSAGARANRGSETREIHFKDGDAYLSYLSEYGAGSMYDAMVNHIGGLAKDIGLVERYGPNPNAQMRLQLDIAQRADGGVKRIFGLRPESYWQVLSGAAGTPASPRLAQIGQHVRNIETFGKLQGAVLSSVTDLGTYFVTTGFNKLSYWDGLKNIGKAFDGDTRDFLSMHGLIAESMSSNLNRWSGEHIKNNWSGRVANATMRLSLMNAWTDTLRHGFALTMMNGLAKQTRKAWTALDEYDRFLLERKGITEADWQLLQQVQLTQHRGLDFLTPESIALTGDPRAAEVTTKVLGYVIDESHFAVVNPDLAARTAGNLGGTQAGTIRGEAARAVMQFKSFPLAMMSRHWRRMLETPQGMQGAPMMANRLAYGGAMLLSLTALGAIAFQTKQIVSGKDPVDMTSGKFWLRAAAQGGALGFYGDLLLGDTTDDRTPQNSLFRLLGPTADSGAQLWELTKGNADEWIAGKDAHAGAEALRFARGHLPLVNLWYGKAAIDHMGLHAIQENLSPGYLARMRGKAKKDWGQDFFWRPGDGLPDRAPSFSELAGG